ncbi:MAG: sigma-70 family RNA polymerase sigma factor [Planctomycetes bacterium]|nr:sigma-70 family RNA polymerase sigma factor [Planctomycetota bacterium]
MESKSKLELIAKAKQGDRRAFSRLLELCHNRLHVLVGLRLGPKLRQEVEVDDVLQETYLRAFRSLDRFTWRHEGSFLQWLATIAEHVIRDLARRHGAQKRNGTGGPPVSLGAPLAGGGSSKDLKDLLAANSTSPSRKARRDERFRRLETSLKTLKPAQQEAIVLAWIHGLPIKEVARRMGRSPDAVSMLILRGLRNLRRLFGSTDSLRLPPRTLRSRFKEPGTPDHGPSHGSLPPEDGTPESRGGGDGLP